MSVVEAMRWSEDGSAVDIIDQRALPGDLIRLSLRSADDLCDAILTLAVRGAPAIGITAAMGLVVALSKHTHLSRDLFLAQCNAFAERVGGVRPTAVNLSWAMRRMTEFAQRASGDARDIHAALRREANAIRAEDRAMCQQIGEHGLALIPHDARIITHCNAGALATGGIGTALAPLYLAAERGHNLHVFADETRPLFQGSRLTAWELAQAGIPVTIIADSMAASVMRDLAIDLVIVGADRIAANGDIANKIGTYPLAISARHHGIPFYVAAPTSTVDPGTARGTEIAVEQRAEAELRRIGNRQLAPELARVFNPAFDVTPAELVTAVITNRGVHRPPYDFSRHVEAGTV